MANPAGSGYEEGLGELPEDLLETGPPILDPGGAQYGDWLNPYTALSYAFIIGDGETIKVLPANRRRTYLLIQNKNTAAIMFFDFGKNASTNSPEINGKGNYEAIGGSGAGTAFCPRDDVYVRGSIANHTGVIIEGIYQPTEF